MTGPRIGALFAGYGGLELGVQQALGGSVAWHAETNPGASKILAHHYPDVPNLGDVTKIDWSQVEPVEVITGGSPCQDVSSAGKRAGMRPGTRSGLWAAMCDAIDIIRPQLVIWENVRGVLSAGADSAVEPCPICVGDERDSYLRALGRVVGDLSECGFVGRWVGVRASDVGAPHGRFRVFVAAWPEPGDPDGVDSDRRATPGLAGQTRPAPRRQTAADPGGETVGFRAGLRADEPPGIGWGRLDDGRAPLAAADPDGELVREQPVGVGGRCGPAVTQHPGTQTATDPDSDGLEGVRGVDTAGCDPDRRSSQDTLWGDYEPAVRRWEHLTRPAPTPTEPGRTGQRLSPRFVEWLMGLPDGWVTGVPGVTRNEALTALGNGCVPQQVTAAVRQLLEGAP